MKLYNTLRRTLEDFQPAQADYVSLYTCGPTVYDYYHIGNLRNAVFNDTLRRTLEMNNYAVKHVMNITDVGHLVSDADEGEDKLQKGAEREGKTVWEVAEHYTEAFKNDMTAINVLPPNGYKNSKHDDTYARATDFIAEQIEMIKLLLDNGFAYQTKQAIYFSVTKLPDYGLLTGQRLADKEIGARTDVVTDADKQNPHDFAVWFFAVGHFANHTMQWESPWGNGFPGWHLECSAIIHATLGDPIDIHTGGIDHIGTHHPNEMAQTEAAFGHSLARFWVHNEFILVDGAKMSKSKGNSFTLKDVVERGFDPLALRLLYLQAHYRTELNFSWENLEAAQNRLKGYQAMADMLWQPLAAERNINLSDHKVRIMSLLQDDLDTPQALVLLSEISGDINESLIHPDEVANIREFLQFIDKVFGLGLSNRKDIESPQKDTLKQRQQARDSKEWAKSDELRDQLKEQRIGVRDTDNGQIWFRT